MTTRKPKQDLESFDELVEQMQLAEAVPNRKVETSIWVGGEATAEGMIQLPFIVRPPRGRLH